MTEANHVDDDMIAGLDRHDLVKVVGALDIARRLGLGIFHRMRQAAARFRFEDVGNRVRNQGHILLHEIGREIGRELDSSDRAAVAQQSRAFFEDGSIGSLARTCALHLRCSMIRGPLVRAWVAKQKADDDWESKAPELRFGCARRELARRAAGSRGG
jgi:hypothetical protein